MVSWSSLFLPHSETEVVVQALRDSLQTLGYAPFNPFGLMPGRTYPQAVRLFVAPAQDGWVRVLGEPDEKQLTSVAQALLCLRVALMGSEARIEVYAKGEQKPSETALLPYLKPGVSAEMLHSALSLPGMAIHSQPTEIDFVRDALPEEVKAIPVDSQKAQKMFDRLSASLTQRSGNAGNEAAARDLLRGERADWNSVGGARIRAVMDCLTIPQDWINPDFVTLRDAYQLHERRRRNSGAMLYPGDAEAMAAVPNALEYTVVYAGKG